MTIVLIIAVTVLATCLPVAYTIGVSHGEAWRKMRGETRLQSEDLNEQTTMRPIQETKYLVGEEPATIGKGNVREELKRMTEWLRKRGQPNGYGRRRAQEGEEGMTPKEHAAAYLSKLQDRKGMIPDDIDDDVMEEIVQEMEEAFEACAKDHVDRALTVVCDIVQGEIGELTLERIKHAKPIP
jgi:hypothetical protein